MMNKQACKSYNNGAQRVHVDQTLRQQVMLEHLPPWRVKELSSPLVTASTQPLHHP